MGKAAQKLEPEERQKILDLLDYERQTVVYPGATRFLDAGVVRDVSAGGKACEIVYSSSAETEIDTIIEQQRQFAHSAQYELEWKVYGHDSPPSLGERLAAAGFTPCPKEMFMVFAANTESMGRFEAGGGDVRRITDREGLRDYQIVHEEVYGRSNSQRIEQYGLMLEKHPSNLSVYVAYVDDEPAACGRAYFHANSRFAGLYGGQTRARFRRRGLFTQLVAVRIREAVGRGILNICVDALPTSEPILRKHGFVSLTYTQPFTFAG